MRIKIGNLTECRQDDEFPRNFSVRLRISDVLSCKQGWLDPACHARHRPFHYVRDFICTRPSSSARAYLAYSTSSVANYRGMLDKACQCAQVLLSSCSSICAPHFLQQLFMLWRHALLTAGIRAQVAISLLRFEAITRSACA